MFINGFLHSGASILSDFVQDILGLEIANGGDECYFLRENGAAADSLQDSHSQILQSPVQANWLFKLYIIKQLLLGKYSFSSAVKRISYNIKCKKYWNEINLSNNENEKLLLIEDFYCNSREIFINAFSLEMPSKLLERIFKSDICLFPLRDIFSQLQDIESQNFFFGPFRFNIEYILGKYELSYVRRAAYLEVYERRLKVLKELKSNTNIVVVDVERLLTDYQYRNLLCVKLGGNPNGQKFEKLKLLSYRPWLSLTSDDFFSDQKISIYHGELKERVIRIQLLIDELKCGSF